MNNSIWTLDEINEQISHWKKAYTKASTGQSYTIGSRTLTRYDLASIRKQLDYLEGEKNKIISNRKPLQAVKAKFPR